MTYPGLTAHEASLLLKSYGPNQISLPHTFSWLKLLLKNLFSILNLLLIMTAVISYVIGEFLDSGLIFLIVALNTLTAFYQEFRAEKTLSALKNLNPETTRVIRDRQEISINSEKIVPGDIVILEAGDKIPADGLVVVANNFEVNESALTGESIPVYKKSDEPEHNLVFGGTSVSNGHGVIKISDTGNKTRFGQISGTLSTIIKSKTNLQIQIKTLAWQISFAAILLSISVFFLASKSGFKPLTAFLTATAAAVAMIPEGLPTIILITLAIGVRRMADRKVIVRKLTAIEGLGSINCICTDKTGTLTAGTMNVDNVWINRKFYQAQNFKPALLTPEAKILLDVSVLVNTASLTQRLNRPMDVLGDSTEGALLLFADKYGVDYELHRANANLIDEFSFDQSMKIMSAVIERDNNRLALVKGAPEIIIDRATRISINGQIQNLTEADKKEIVDVYESLTKQGLRVLGTAYKPDLPRQEKYNRTAVESDLILLGFLALRDPIRPEAKKSIAAARAAGIRTIMITGDNELTALNIAQELGLAEAGDEVLLGRVVASITDDELFEVINRVKIFARVNPEDKLRIVQAFQKSGFSVAVTGDGVNDALALKQAEIGVAMGHKGTDVAKEAADVIVTDDNYSSIISAIEEGRTIYDNILKSIKYLISTNFGEMLTILMALLFGLPAPLLPVQILWINLVSDGLPALALALDPKDPEAMSKPPRSRRSGLITKSNLKELVSIACAVAFFTLIIYTTVLETTENLDLARTWAFISIIIFQMFAVFLIRGARQQINRHLFWAVGTTLVIQAVIVLSPIFYPFFKIQRPW